MAAIVCYIAVSIDGFIAGPGGSVEWLNGFEDALAGFAEFDRSIACSVMGRETCEFMRKHMPVNPADTRRCAVLTARDLGEVPANVEAYRGDIRELANSLRETASRANGDVWLLGGGKANRAFADANAIDRWRLFVIPVLLGDGVRLLGEGPAIDAQYRTVETRMFASGVVEIVMERK
jgi:dihydrofolate reductase